MSLVPGRPLPGVRVVPEATAETGDGTRVVPVTTRPPERGRRPRGLAREVRASVRDGRPVIEVELDGAPSRPAWGGRVDHGIGWRRAGAALARFARDSRLSGSPGIPVPGEVPVDRVRDLVLGYLVGAHGQDVSAAEPEPVAPDLVLGVGSGSSGDDDEKSVSREVAAAVEAARATVSARDLAGTPSNIKTPEWLAARMAGALGDAGMQTRVLAGDALVEGGFGGVLAVGGGSDASPRVLVARRPGPGLRVLLVGKGITFDTGGISVKPADGMHLMRTDMAGSAAVAAAAEAFCRDGSPGAADLDLTVVVPMAENMLSGSAYRPGDVITHVGGITTEVTNTDAEGRLVLADALAHGIEISDPEVVVDVATLTGAMKVALGMRTGALMATDDDLADRVAAAGALAGERWWRLPLPEDLRSAVNSDIADRNQTPKGPGAITAALFLEGFVDDRPWVHLDIAGPARADEEIDEVGPVSTGFAARTLLGFLRELAHRPRR